MTYAEDKTEVGGSTYGGGAATVDGMLMIFHKHGITSVGMNIDEPKVIGRSAPADLVFEENQLSREHARFCLRSDGMWVEDLRSTNGTRFNGERLGTAARRLTAADTVTMAGLTVRVSYTDDSPLEDLESQIAAARHVQLRLVGPAEVISRPGLRVAGHYEPAAHCSGDFWNHFDLTAGSSMVVIGDVTGHGVGQAMITASVKTCCDTIVARARDDFDLPDLLGALNRAVLDAGQHQHLMSLVATVLDIDKKVAMFGCAAHPSPLLCRRDGERFVLSAPAARPSQLLGKDTESDFHYVSVLLEDGDTLVWFTDGVPEAEGPDGDTFGSRALHRTILRNAHLPVDALRDAIVREHMAFRAGVAQADDVALVVARVG